MERTAGRLGSNFDPYVNFWQCGQIWIIFGYVKWFEGIFLKNSVSQSLYQNQNTFYPNIKEKCWPFLLIRRQHFFPLKTTFYTTTLWNLWPELMFSSTMNFRYIGNFVGKKYFKNKYFGYDLFTFQSPASISFQEL